MAIERFWEDSTVLNYPLDLVHKSLNDLKRMHKWNCTVYFEEEGPGEVDCKFLTVIPGYDPVVQIYSDLKVTRTPDLMPQMNNPTVSYGVRNINSSFPACGGNIFRIELFSDTEFPEDKTKVTFSRSMYFGDDNDVNINLRTKYGKCNMLIFEGLKTLELDDEGFLSIIDKPSEYNPSL